MAAACIASAYWHRNIGSYEKKKALAAAKTSSAKNRHLA